MEDKEISEKLNMEEEIPEKKKKPDFKKKMDNLKLYLERKKREYIANRPVKMKRKRVKPGYFEKAMLCILGIAVLLVGVYFAYYYFHYVSYDEYKKYISEAAVEEGKPMIFVEKEDSNLPGFKEVCENERLCLYTNTDTCNVAVFDKETGEYTFTNPINADEDRVANEANINLLKSQFVLSYYNSLVTSGTFNSYEHSVALGNVRYESIENGIRYIYSIGDNLCSFEIPLEYRLYEDYLEANVPASLIKESGDGYIYKLQLLRFMGAADTDEEGYMVVPNGSGSIINFNNGKTKADSYSQYIYNIDPLCAGATVIDEKAKKVSLPVFGICRKESSILASVEEGMTNCVIQAGISGVYNEYNYVYPSFFLRYADNLINFGEAAEDIFVMEPDFYKSDMKVRYTFLDSSKKGYPGLAMAYRDRLEKEGRLKKSIDDKEDIPFFADLLIDASGTGHFLGVRYNEEFTMTTFDEAALISDEMRDRDIDNQLITLYGWNKGGYYPYIGRAGRVKSGFNEKDKLDRLKNCVNQNGGRLYLDVPFLKVSCRDNQYPYSKESSRYYGKGFVAGFGMVDPSSLQNTAALGYEENRYYCLSPKFLPRYIDKFIQASKDLSKDGIALRDMGSFLASDKKRTEFIERETSKRIVEGELDKLLENEGSLIIRESNDYGFRYLQAIPEAPLYAYSYEICDEEIPFYEMIIHGFLDYSSADLNYINEDNRSKEILHLIEYGASPKYVFTYEHSEKMKESAMNRFYSTGYKLYSDKSAALYKEVNDCLKHVRKSEIINHEIINQNARRITYDNGVSIYINYGDTPLEILGKRVEAMSFLLEGID